MRVALGDDVTVTVREAGGTEEYVIGAPAHVAVAA
jgi:hypothetical protein